LIIDNDTTLPVSDQVNDISSMVAIDTTLNIEIINSLIEDVEGLANVIYIDLYLEGNRKMDTLFLGDNITRASTIVIDDTYLEHIYGLKNVRGVSRIYIGKNLHLQSVDLDLSEMDSTYNGTTLDVTLNDSLKTFNWGNPHEKLRNLSFFDNRQLRHVHIETVRNKINGEIEFNPDLDSISGFVGLDSVRFMTIKNNYKLAEACVFQKGIDNFLIDNPTLTHFFEIQNNATGLKSLNDLLTADCSWLPNGVEEPFLGDLHIYPNPAHTEVFIPVPEKPTVYHIYDMTGKVVSSGLVASDGRISLANVSKGMYVLLVGNKRNKLMVQ
jgi:hypothetical protein